MPGFGLLAGLLIRRACRSSANRPTAIVLAVAAGALAQSAAGVAWNVIYSRAVGISISWGLMVPYVAVAAAISGGLGALVLAISRNRVRGWLGLAATLVLVLLVALLASVLAAFLVANDLPVMVLRPFAMLNAIFLLGMFITGRPRHS
jgi:hypothetical protein